MRNIGGAVGLISANATWTMPIVFAIVAGRVLNERPIHEPVDRSQQMIGRNVRLERKLIEQRGLLNSLMSYHDSVLSQ